MTPAEEDAFVARYLDHDTEGRPNGFAKIMTDEEFRLAIRAAVAQERERAERAEGKVEGLLLESEAAHANLTALRDDRRKLQKALAFWMPCIASEDTKAGKRVAEEANLLIGLPVKDNEPCAQELGWIVMESEADLLRQERNSAEARAEAFRSALLELRIRLHSAGRRPEECHEMSLIDAAIAGEK